MFHDDMDFIIRTVLYKVVISIDDKLFKLMFDDNFHICMIYGIEIQSIKKKKNRFSSIWSALERTQRGKGAEPIHTL
jgi:hypothetical protein